MSQFFEIQDTAGNPLTSLEINAPLPGITPVGTLRVKASEAWTGAFNVQFGVMPVDQVPATISTVRGLAARAADGHWFEARLLIGAGPWTPVGGHPLDPTVAVLDMPSTGPDYQDVELRLNIPANTEVGAFCVLPFVLWY